MKNSLKVFLALSFLIAPTADIRAEDSSPWKNIKWAAGEIRDPLAVLGTLLYIAYQIKNLTAKPEKKHVTAKELEAEAREKSKNAQTLKEKLEAEELLEDARKLRELEIAAEKQYHKTEEMVDELEYEQAKETLSYLFKNKPGDQTLAQQSGLSAETSARP